MFGPIRPIVVTGFVRSSDRYPFRFKPEFVTAVLRRWWITARKCGRIYIALALPELVARPRVLTELYGDWWG